MLSNMLRRGNVSSWNAVTCMTHAISDVEWPQSLSYPGVKGVQQQHYMILVIAAMQCSATSGFKPLPVADH
jgi:hypothetical protein